MNLHDEPFATDTIYFDTPAIADGSTCVQLIIGNFSLVSDIYGVKTENQFVNTLEENIRAQG